MMTQTHVLVAATLFAKPGEYSRNIAAIAGSLMPDFALYGLFAWHLLMGDPPDYIFNTLYWSAPWQSLMAPGNSFLLYGGLALLALFMIRKTKHLKFTGHLLMVFSIAALLHVATDFPLHVQDAHSHFWPATDWKFISAFSYWDDRYHAKWIAPIETLLAIGCLVILFRRFNSTWVRLLLGTALLAYIAVPLSFRLGMA